MQDDPAVAPAVLGELQPVAVVEELADPLRNQGHGDTLACSDARSGHCPRRGHGESLLRPVPRWARIAPWTGTRTSPRRLWLALATRGRGVRRRRLGHRPRPRSASTPPPWCPAAGVGVLAALLAPRRRGRSLVAAVFLAFALANLTGGQAARSTRSCSGCADAAEAALVAGCSARVLIGRRIRDVQDVWRLFAIAVTGALVAGSLRRGDRLRRADRRRLLAHPRPGRALRTRASVMLLAPLAC